MTVSSAGLALLTVAALALGAPARAQMASAIALQKVLVPSADAPWLADWYERQRGRFGEVFGPRIEVTTASGIDAALALSPSAVAFFPAGLQRAESGAGLNWSDIGVDACLAVISAEGSSAESLGDLHATEGRPRIAVPADIRHLVEEALSLYGLAERVERVATDNEGAATATAMGEVALGFLSASNGQHVVLPAENLRMSKVPQAVLDLAGQERLFVGGFRTGEPTWRDSGEEHLSLCDPVVAVTTDISRFRDTNFKAEAVTVAGSEDAGLLQRSAAALQKFIMIVTAN